MKISRRTLVIACVILVVVLIRLLDPASDSLQRRVTSGVVEGTLSEDGGALAFKGIPYAAPPVGDLRWKPPQPLAPWKGVRPVRSFAPRAMQKHIWDDLIFFDDGPSEDCLYLNVWAPKDMDRETLPVMFWIHGGGFRAGGTSEPRQNGEELAKKGVVVVSVTYRMGVFGFFAHPELSAESPYGASGNYGLLDMVAALEWVRDNIASFGGDPQNVTIFGESAGSKAVSSLMASPLAKSLFHKAIGQSDGLFEPWDPMLARVQGEEMGMEFAEVTLGTTSLDALRALSGDEILDAAWEDYERWDFEPIVDGYYLEETVSDVFEEGRQIKVPLLAGWNLDEKGSGDFLGDAEATVANYAMLPEETFGEKAERFLEVYAATDTDEVERAAADYAGDHSIGYGTWKWIETHVATSDAPVYRYRFDQTLPLPTNAPADAKPRAAHAWDIEYVFRVIDSKDLPWRAEDRQVSELMSTYWTNFAKTGNPNGPDVPDWPAYNGSPSRPVMHIDATPEIMEDTHRARFEFLETLSEYQR